MCLEIAPLIPSGLSSGPLMRTVKKAANIPNPIPISGQNSEAQSILFKKTQQAELTADSRNHKLLSLISSSTALSCWMYNWKTNGHGLKFSNLQLLMVQRQNISDPVKALDMYSFLALFKLL